MDPRPLLQTAVTAARAAADVHRAHLGRVPREDWAEKGIADYVTFVDREAEARILECIRDRFPDHAILAEESAATPPDGETPDWLWIVDPLDGTTNYLHRYPMYSVSVAVAHRGELVAGVVLSSASGEEWTAVRGGGARKDGRPIRVSALDRLTGALVGTGFPFKAPDRIPTYMRQFEAVLRTASDLRRGGSAALDLCHLASGYLDAFWELVLAPWDVAAGSLMVREAGGLVTDLGGDPGILRGGPILAGNPALHAALRALLRSTETPPARMG